MKTCNVCGSVEGVNAVEVFGRIALVEHGCSACVGISFFPDFDRVERNFRIKQIARYLILSLLVALSSLCSGGQYL